MFQTSSSVGKLAERVGFSHSASAKFLIRRDLVASSSFSCVFSQRERLSHGHCVAARFSLDTKPDCPRHSGEDKGCTSVAERVGFEGAAPRGVPRVKKCPRLPALDQSRKAPWPCEKLAERVGFEPTSPVLPGYPLSRRALSTAQTPLRSDETILRARLESGKLADCGAPSPWPCPEN